MNKKAKALIAHTAGVLGAILVGFGVIQFFDTPEIIGAATTLVIVALEKASRLVGRDWVNE
jgi:ABC-type hemin transport system substrate-binding protein